eukprot:TRINITY_DN11324_c0_g1_i1.p1 TRINITY_DN11324_c0_g1~~TRINITY_DN11324_c0_g1_i1.p1  ORF type:complete len:656 (-),score=233.74 TRINITY_DN11324_c0_g1_i1:27-1946(-)
MVDNVDRDAAFAHGQSVASSSVAFWDQIRKTSLFYGDEPLKRFVIDTSRNAGEVILQIKATLGDYTYAPMTKMKEVVIFMSQLNQLVMSCSKSLEDAIIASGAGFRNPALQTELDIMNDQKRRFIATMSMLGEWLKFQRDRINKHSQQNNMPSPEAQYLAQQEAKKREEQLVQQQYEEWKRKQEQERAQREELEKMRQMEQMMAREREEKERNRLFMEQKKREEEARLMEAFRKEQEEAARREEQRLQDAWKAKRESIKVDDDRKADLMARLQRSGSGNGRPVSGRVSPMVDRQQEDLADELLKELGVTFVEPKSGNRSLDSSPLVRSGSNSSSPLLKSGSISRQSSRASLNVDELLGSLVNNNPPPKSMVRNPSTTHTSAVPPSSSSKPDTLPEDPWDSLEKLADSISKRHSIVPSPSNSSSSYPSNRSSMSSPKIQLDSSPQVEAKSSLDSLLESMEAQVYPPNSPSDGQYRRSLLYPPNNSIKVTESPVPQSPSPSPPQPKEGSSGPFPGLSWRDQTINSSNSIEEIMSQLSVGEMRSSMRIPPAMISPISAKRSTDNARDSSGSNDEISKKIADLEAKKKAAVADEDYSLATKLKEQIDELKAVADLRAMDSPDRKKPTNAKNEIDDLIRDLESL